MMEINQTMEIGKDFGQTHLDRQSTPAGYTVKLAKTDFCIFARIIYFHNPSEQSLYINYLKMSIQLIVTHCEYFC